MIGKLKGVVDSFGEDWVILDVAGVGYEISCSPATLAALPAIGQQAFLSIETHVREDQIRLFGFRNETERAWFRLLQSVQGVGAKVALAVLGTLDADYRGEVFVTLYCLPEPGRYVVEDGERIAQLVVARLAPGELKVVDELDATSRGAGGHGSTGRL